MPTQFELVVNFDGEIMGIPQTVRLIWIIRDGVTLLNFRRPPRKRLSNYIALKW